MFLSGLTADLFQGLGRVAAERRDRQGTRHTSLGVG